MAIVLQCERCGMRYQASEAEIGQPVQCWRCRFIMIVPRPAGFKTPAPIGRVTPPLQQALDAAAEMEQTASRSESPLIIRRPWYKPWVKPHLGEVQDLDESRQATNRRPRSDWRLIGIGVLPVLVAAAMLYYLVPWSRMSGSKPARATSPEENVSVAPSVEVPAIEAARPLSQVEVLSAKIQPASSTSTADAPAINVPHWMAQDVELARFGPYVSYKGFALRGPVRGMRLMLVAKGGLTWIGPEKNGITPYLLMNVSPPDTVAVEASPSAGDRGFIGNILTTRQVSVGAAVTPGGPTPLIQIYSAPVGSKQVVVRLQCASDDAETLATLQALAFTLRAATGDELPVEAGALPSGYDRAAHPLTWTVDQAVLPLLMGKKNAVEYTIHPPLGLKNQAPGNWMGEGKKLKLDGVSTPLPLLRIEVEPLAGAEYHTPREWAAAQWTQSGRDADWGVIDGIVFACVKWTEPGAGQPALCERYVGVIDERFVSITIANWAGNAGAEPLKALRAAVRTIHMKQHVAP